MKAINSLLVAALLSLVACSGQAPTAGGTVLAHASLDQLVPAEARARLPKDPTATYERVVKLGVEGGEAAEVAVKFSAWTDPSNGGKYIKDVDLSVRSNGGYVLTGSVSQNPVNRGTEQQPIMGINIMATFFKKNFLSSHGGSRSWEVVADGNLKEIAP